MKQKDLNKQIPNLVEQIASKFRPEKIILFGSLAYGEPDEDSDVDLLVVMDFEGSCREQAVHILQSVDYHLPLDLIVRDRHEVSRRIEAGDFFLKDLMEKGKVVYEQPLS